MKNKILISFIIFFSAFTFPQIKLPKLISDGMILQRDAEVNIWGWAETGESITIKFLDSTYKTAANKNGEWNIILSNLKAGGPYSMEFSGKNSIKINDILIGDVWVCSGQSNMELPMRRVSWIYEDEIKNSKNNFIREFSVPQKYNFNDPQKDLSGGEWKSANPENVLDFSAAAYFFAKELYEKYKVPVGLIDASLGGSPVQAWLSEEALKKFPEYYEEAKKFRDSSLIKQIEESDRKRINAWHKLLNEKDEGYNDSKNIWHKPELSTTDWKTVNVPLMLDETELNSDNGVVWFRKKIILTKDVLKNPAKIILGRIKDADSVFINGVFVGTTGYEWPPRRYNIPREVLKEGENIIVVRLISNSGIGGFIPDKNYEIIFGDTSINLEVEWQYKIGAVMEPLASQTFIRWKPLGLFNAMISPLTKFRIKGVIWYQGESNANNPDDYAELFSSLIKDWRSKWQQGNFPFLFVQLANYMEENKSPSESNWALLREAQLKALTLPNTGMAVTIDIGEWNDIHPLNKKDVGARLGLAAKKIAYGADVIASGPIYNSMVIEDNKIILAFENTGSGLIAKDDDKLNYFSIAGEDSQFVWANAVIENNRVVIWNDEIENPIAVRYAWADNPADANLYNKEGLPASPFRTDNFSINSLSEKTK